MGNTFCKIKDENNTYILVDKNKQPLNCSEKGCIIMDYNSIINDNKQYKELTEKDIIKETNISCSLENDGYIKDNTNIKGYNKAIPNNNIIDPNGNKIDFNQDEFKKFENTYGSTLMMANIKDPGQENINKDNLKKFQEKGLNQIFNIIEEPEKKEEKKPENKEEKKPEKKKEKKEENIIESNDSLKIILIILFVLVFLIIILSIIYIIYAFTRVNNNTTNVNY